METNTIQPAKNGNSSLGRWRIRCGVGCLTLAGLGIFVRLACRDRWLVTALLFYATPPVVLLALSLAAWWCLPRPWLPRVRLLLVAIAMGAAWTTWSQVFTTAPRPPTTTDIRFVFWNVCSGKLGWDRILAELEQADADIMALAEACRSAESPTAHRLSQRFPDYEQIILPRGLVLLTRLPVARMASRVGTNHAALEWVKFTSPGSGDFSLLLADLPSDLLLHRKAPIADLVESVADIEGPCLIAGDMNTPVDSVFFEPIRAQFQNGFEVSGRGLHTTWPMPIPVMAIDHLWGNANIEFVETRVLRTLKSDHCPLKSVFRIRHDGAEPDNDDK